MPERNSFNPYPRVSDQEAIEALKAWGIEIKPTGGMDFQSSQLAVEQPQIPNGQQPKRRGIDLGRRDVSLGKGWF